MKNTSSFCLLFLFIFSPCKAQYNCLGGDIGLTGTHPLILQNGKFVSIGPSYKEFGIGFAFHFNSEINFSRHFSLDPSLGLEYWTVGNNLTGGRNRLVLSALLRFYPASPDFDNPKIRWYCQAGPYYGLGIGPKTYFPFAINVWPDSRSIYGLKLGTGVTFPLWNGFALAGVDAQSYLPFASAIDLNYPQTGTIIKTKEASYNILLTVGYSYPFDFRHFKFLSVLNKPGTK